MTHCDKSTAFKLSTPSHPKMQVKSSTISKINILVTLVTLSSLSAAAKPNRKVGPSQYRPTYHRRSYASAQGSLPVSKTSTLTPNSIAIVDAIKTTTSVNTSTAMGVCCSSCATSIPFGMPRMDSVWWSNSLSNGARIQIRANTWSTWWTPQNGSDWNSTIKAFNKTAPPTSTYFIVITLDTNTIMLKTPDDTYVRAGPAYSPYTYGQMDTTTNASDPRTILTIERVRKNSINIKCYDGLYVSSTGEFLMRWGTKANAWEVFDVREVTTVPAIRGVNLGSWLVTERWMVPDLYPKLPTWGDGTAIKLQSMSTGKWVYYRGHDNKIVLGSDGSSANVSFNIRRTRPNVGKFQFLSANSKFWTMPNATGSFIFSGQDEAGTVGYEDFDVVFRSNDSTMALVVAPNGMYLRATSGEEVIADVSQASVDRTLDSTWSGPCAFNITMAYVTEGEWQLSSYLGPQLANETMSMHHATFITEADWAYMKNQSINSVRIPIGYWLTQDPAPEYPFSPEYSASLDWAFAMGNKYGIRIWISMHGLPGSQSGWGNTGTRDGKVRWHLGENYNRSLDAIRWISSRYQRDPSWLGIGLMNEGTTEVPLDLLQKYYREAYEIVRSYSPCAYVSIEPRIGSNPWSDVFWIMLSAYYTNVVIEVHSYQVFGLHGGDYVVTPEDEINYIKNNKLNDILALQSYGQKLLIGEFSNAMKTVANATQQAEFSKAQIQTMGRANMGWFFWSLKLNRTGYAHWDWYKSSENGWLPKKPDGNWW